MCKPNQDTVKWTSYTVVLVLQLCTLAYLISAFFHKRLLIFLVLVEFSILNNHKLELTLDNNEIQTADTFKLLGIQLDQMLTLDKQTAFA